MDSKQDQNKTSSLQDPLRIITSSDVPQGINPYNYRKANVIKPDKVSCLICTHIFTFTNKGGHQYIVNIEEHEGEMYIIKFHLKSHSNSPNRYSLITKQYDARNIIHTCLKIGHDIYMKQPMASFGFIGAPSDGESKNNTKRFKLYSKISAFFFDPNNFEHKHNKEYSSYLLLNKQKIQQNPNYYNNMFDIFGKYYNTDELYGLQ